MSKYFGILLVLEIGLVASSQTGNKTNIQNDKEIQCISP